MFRLSWSNNSVVRAALLAFAVAAISAVGTGSAYADAMAMPALSAPLVGNANPTSISGGILGKFYVTGVASGLAYEQSNPVPGDNHQRLDISNGQLFIQKTDGMFQYFVQVGGYSLPSLGTPYL